VNGVHDMGGAHGHGRIEVEPDEPVFHAPWEGRVYGLQRGMRAAGLMNLDEFRHEQERLPPRQYLALDYYARWLTAMERVLDRTAGVAPVETLPERRAEQRFRPGDRVLVRNVHSAGHNRLPGYVRGHTGVVEAVHGPYRLPDTHAHHRSIDWEPVYTVRFAASDLWGDAAEPRTSVTVDLWQTYLDEATP
jgi:hypothetical protein